MGQPISRFNNEISEGGLVYCLDDLEDAFTSGAINVIEKLYNEGRSLEYIANELLRDPDEVFIAIFHLARQGRIHRKMAYRIV